LHHDLLWEWLLRAPIFLIVAFTLPWSTPLVVSYLAAWLLDRLFPQDLARRHEPAADGNV